MFKSIANANGACTVVRPWLNDWLHERTDGLAISGTIMRASDACVFLYVKL